MTSPARFLICGMPRSGTTLLAEELNRRFDVHIGPETHLVSLAGRDRDPLPDALDADAARALLDEIGATDHITVPAAALDAARARAESGDRAIALTELLMDVAAFGSNADVAAIGEKTPRHLVHAHRLLDLDPELVAIVIERDPRDVCRSLGAVPWSGDSFVASALRWSHYCRLTDTLAADHGERVVTIQFEALVADPETTLAPIAERVPLVTRGGAAGAPSSFDAEREPWKRRATGSVDSSRASAWRDDPHWSDRAIEVLCAPWMRSRGYETAMPSLPGRIAVVLFEAVIGARRRLRRRSP